MPQMRQPRTDRSEAQWNTVLLASWNKRKNDLSDTNSGWWMVEALTCGVRSPFSSPQRAGYPRSGWRAGEWGRSAAMRHCSPGFRMS